jgi:hypothetical protein
MLPRSIVVEFEKWDGEELHIFGNSQNLYSEQIHVRNPTWAPWQKNDGLRSGTCASKSFLHPLGLVMCAGTNGY